MNIKVTKSIMLLLVTMVKTLLGAGLALVLLGGTAAFAAGGTVKGPNVAAPDRYVYYPGTEILKKDEIPLFAAGTGMPAARRDNVYRCSNTF